MKTRIQMYDNLKQKVLFLYNKLKLNLRELAKGRKLAISIPDIITLSIFKQKNKIETKKSIFEIFNLKCSYKTLVVNMNRFSVLAGIILAFLMNLNRKDSHPIKHTDSTDIPVCLNKNAKHHKTMSGLANWGHSGKGLFHGL
jgi:allophanate hydrolase subunit 1